MFKPTEMFSDYRSEWILDDFDARFVEPPYYTQFLDIRPTFLIGGRGTGKTVALRSLHFSHTNDEGRPRHLGIYVKAFKNRILAFSGEHVSEETWTRAFEHYMNLLCSLELADLCIQVFGSNPISGPQKTSVDLLCQYLSISKPPVSFSALYDCLRTELAQLSKYVAAPTFFDAPRLSPGEQPVVDFARDIHRMMGSTSPVYICIDEWENLSKRQQQALNAWIKNSGNSISYKIGVRENGMKTHRTGGTEDLLSSPADYSEERISGNESFCRDVAERRLELARTHGINVPQKLAHFLERVDPTTEAAILGARPTVDEEADYARRIGNRSVAQWLKEAPLDHAYLAIHLRDRGVDDLAATVAAAIDGDPSWKNRIENYRHASLFTISKGRKGVPLRKIYAGSETFLTLCGGNVRYLLELLDEVVRLDSHGEAAGSIDGVVAPGYATQTQAAAAVAKRHLDRIQGLSNEGLRIARLVRSIGTVFADLLRNPRNSAPEQTGFILSGEPSCMEEARDLLEEGRAILAFIAHKATKLTHGTDTQQDEYWLHPILAPYFNISHRRKRRIRIDAKGLLDAAENLEGAKKLHSVITGREIDDPQLDLELRSD